MLTPRLHQPLLALAIASIATGCSHLPSKTHWPVVPTELATAFNPIQATTNPDAYMTAIDTELATLMNAVADAGKRANGQDWGSGDVVTAGGLMAVVGGIAEKIGLVNTGAALGLFGATGRTRYQYTAQRQAYRKAEAGLSCVQTQVRLFNDTNRIMVLTAAAQEERVAASVAPTIAIDAVNKIRHRLILELDSVSTVPSREDLEALAERVSQTKKPPPTTTPEEAKAAFKAVSTSKIASVKLAAIAGAQSAGGAGDREFDPATESTDRSKSNSRGELSTSNQAGAIKPKTAKDDSDVPSPIWLVDDARMIGKSYAAAVGQCAL